MKPETTFHYVYYEGLLHNILTELFHVTDSKDACSLMLLAALCPPNTRINTSGKTFWKPTIVESREGFILHVKVIITFSGENSWWNLEGSKTNIHTAIKITQVYYSCQRAFADKNLT